MALPRRSWIQFSLRSILWLMLCVATGFAAYRRGFEDGFADGANSRHYVGQTYLKAYDVADLVKGGSTNYTPATTAGQLNAISSPQTAWLVADITENVLPNTWDENGGKASMAGFDSNMSIVVSHDQDGHECIANYLQRRRQGKSK